MKTPEKIQALGYLGRLFPLAATQLQARVIYHAFDKEIKSARNEKDLGRVESLEQDRHWEVTEYEDKIRAIKSRRLVAEAERLYVYVPDLEWELGNYGDRYLVKASISKLYHAVKEQKDNIREYRVKLAGALTGIIGALIGLLAVAKK